MTKKRQENYMENVHYYGRLWMAAGVTMMLLVPVAICVRYNAWPQAKHVFQGLLGVAPIFWPLGFIEVFTFSPMLGAGGTYLGFVTGNLANLKVPCALNAMEAAKVEAGTEEGELITTISVAISSVVTTLVIALGVLMLGWLRPILESPALAPAFSQILPALFGGLATVYVARNWKLALTPLLFMLSLFVAIPSLGTVFSVLVPVAALVSIGAGRVLYKRGKL